MLQDLNTRTALAIMSSYLGRHGSRAEETNLWAWIRPQNSGEAALYVKC